MADVSARVETIRAGDRIYTPRGNPKGYRVVALEVYDDGAHVVVYSTGRSSSLRIGDHLLRTADVLASLAPLRAGERLRCRRGGPAPRPAPQRSTV